MNNNLPLPTFSLERFTWNKEKRTLVTEASDLCRIGSKMFDQVWNDSCDLGMAIQSHKTGKTFRFTLEKEDGEKSDGEITCWILHPIAKDCPISSVTIFND